MEKKVEELLEKRSQDIKDEWKDYTNARLSNCESPIERLFFVEWEYQIDKYNDEPEGYKYYICPQNTLNINGKKYRIDFIIHFLSEDDIFDNKRNEKKKDTLLIEIDSYLWHGSEPEQFAKEKRRERELNKEGYNIMRFSGREIYRNVGKCINEVLEYLMEKEDKDFEKKLEKLEKERKG